MAHSLQTIATGQRWRHKVTARELTIISNNGPVIEVRYHDDHTQQIISVISLWGSWDLVR